MGRKAGKVGREYGMRWEYERREGRGEERKGKGKDRRKRGKGGKGIRGERK